MGIKERFDSPEEQQRSAIENFLANMRVAIPGIIISFDEKKQTATVQPAITENVQIGENPAVAKDLPLLVDVPVFFPRAGGYCLTFPVKPDDECLVVFADMCIDGWWQSSGVQDQMETRRHDLSDAMALLGFTSVPRAVKEYSTNSVMLRNEDKDSYFEIVDNDKTINIVGAEKINVTAVDDININTDASINVNAQANITVIAMGDISVIANGNMALHSNGAMSITSDSSILIDSPMTNINP